MRYIPVHGTWSGHWGTGLEQHWWGTGPFSAFMRAHGWEPARPRDPFRWSGDIDGLSGLAHRFLGRPPDETDWLAAADAFRWYLGPLAMADRNVICHSHGLNPVLFACAHADTPTSIRTLVSVGSPVRADMLETATRARARIGCWLHLYDARFDKMGSWGQFGDGKFEWWWSPKSRAHPAADLNVAVPLIGHSGLLEDDTLFTLWQARGWLDVLTTGAIEGHPCRSI